MNTRAKLRRRFTLAQLTGLLALVPAVIAEATYTLQPVLTNRPSQTVDWGSRIRLDFLLSADVANTHNSVIFRVGFSQPGLILESYEWLGPYTNLPPNDDCTPRLASLPIRIDADTFLGPHGSDVVDIELSNVLFDASFGVGTLVSVDLRVPEDFGYVGPLSILTWPDTLALGFQLVPTSAGPPVVLNVQSNQDCDSPGSGDFDDGGIGASDVPHFVNALLRGSRQDVCIGDMNQDGALTGRDLQPFVDAILRL